MKGGPTYSLTSGEDPKIVQYVVSLAVQAA
jgi:hypothetical protein